MHNYMPRTVNETDQPIKTPILNHNRKIVWPVVDLAQVRSPRSGCRLSLRRDRDRGPRRFFECSPRRDQLTWARPPPHPKGRFLA